MAGRVRVALIVAAGWAVLLTFAGCDVEQVLQELSRAKPLGGETASIPAPSEHNRDPEHITIASFNIQVFGRRN